jgi:L-methionine (R)-S-oxide reductase
VSESIPDLRSLPRRQAYVEIERNLDSILAGVTDEIAVMTTLAAFVHHSLGFLWTGFYRVTSPGVLQVGPYQGSLGCIEIKFGRGVCGKAAAEKTTVVVADVEKVPGHISCDSRSRSEIVVPVVDASDNLVAVFDVDAETVGAFSDDDRAGLESIVRRFRKN